LELTQRLSPPRSISVRQQQIETEAHKCANAIRLLLDNSTVEIIGKDPPRLAQTERPFGQSECLLPLRCIAQLISRDVVDRHLSKVNVPTRHIDTARQSM